MPLATQEARRKERARQHTLIARVPEAGEASVIRSVFLSGPGQAVRARWAMEHNMKRAVSVMTLTPHISRSVSAVAPGASESSADRRPKTPQERRRPSER